MGRIPTSQPSRRIGRIKTLTTRPDISNLQGLAQFAKQRGFEKEVEKIIEKPKLSVLQRLGRGLTAFEVGNAIYQARYEEASFLPTYLKDVGIGLWEAISGREIRETPKKTFKDIMVKMGWQDRPGKIDIPDVVGLAADIATDPLTWFGGYLGKGVFKTIGTALNYGKKIPYVGKAITGTEKMVGSLFVPFYKIKKLGPKGEKYIGEFLKYSKATRAELDDFLQTMREAYQPAKKIPEAGKKIGIAVETGQKTGNKLLDDIMDRLIKTQKKLTKEEVKRGILKYQLPDYMHHMLTPEASDLLHHGVDLSALVKPLRVRLGAAKHRKILGIVTEINERAEKVLGIKLFEEDAFRAFAKRGLDSVKAIRTYDFLQRTANQFGKKASRDFIDRFGVKWVETGAKELKGIRFPQPIAQHIDEFKKFLTNDEATNAFVRFYDKIHNFWKGTVTGYFPAFHTRNAIGAVFNNWIAGLKNPLLYKRADDILKGKKGFLKLKNGKNLSYDTIRKLLKENGVVGQTGFLDVSQWLRRGLTESGVERAIKLPQRLMGVIEDRVRTPLFLDGLQRGLDPVKSAKRVIKYHFDYMPEGFTPFERMVMKRIIPFYTWTRHNIPLQIEQLIMQPQKYSGIMKVFRAAGPHPSGEEEELLPIWLRERFTIKAEGGYWSGIGTPLEEATEKLSDPLRGFGVSLSPFIRVPFEQLTGFNIFKDRRIDEDRYGKLYKNMPQPIKKWLRFKEHRTAKGKKYYTVDPRRKYWLETIASRGWNTAVRVSNYVDDKKNLLSLITTIRKYNYTLDDLKRWSESDLRKQLESMLLRAGELSQFQRTYVPKK